MKADDKVYIQLGGLQDWDRFDIEWSDDELKLRVGHGYITFPRSHMKRHLSKWLAMSAIIDSVAQDIELEKEVANENKGE